ncbi:MAG: hypothetical protein AAB456_02600 [Patescibacteria group bacterium]
MADKKLTIGAEDLDTKKLRIVSDDQIVHKTELNEFVRQALEIFKAKDRKQDETIKALSQAFQQLMKDLRKQVDGLFVSDRVKKLEEDHSNRMGGVDNKMNDVDLKVSKIKNGDRGIPGPMGRQGPAGSADTPNQVVGKINLSDELIDVEKVKGLAELQKKVDIATKQEARRVIAGPRNLWEIYDVSSQADGSNRTFAGLPTARFYPFAFSSQAPFNFFVGTHYSIVGKSIVLNNAIEPIASGQTLYVVYIK